MASLLSADRQLGLKIAYDQKVAVMDCRLQRILASNVKRQTINSAHTI